MDNIDFGKEVKIEINKKNRDHFVEAEETEIGVVVPAKKRFFSLEKLSALIFCIVVFLMPVFVLPTMIAPVASGKAIIFYCGIFLTMAVFVLSAIKNGGIQISKSALLAGSGLMALVWLLSSLFSENYTLSLFGKLYDADTFILILTSFVSLFLASTLFRSEKRAVVFYLTLFCSAVIVFLFQLVHIIFGINILPFSAFPQKTSNLIGSWNDFSVFFGLVGVLALVFLETAKIGKKIKFFLRSALAMAFLALFGSSFGNSWIVFGIFSLFIFITTLNENHIIDGKISKRFVRVSFFATVLSLLFILFSGTTGKLAGSFGLFSSEIRPSWQATIGVAKQTLKKDIVLGTGPNTFLNNWLKFKPAEINNTAFWNARFSSGSGFFASALSTVGVLGAFSFVAFLVVLLIQCGKVFYRKQSSNDNSLITASFFGSVYLWVHIVLYSPGILVLTTAFVLTGVFLALITNDKRINVINLDLSRKNRTSFVFALIAIMAFVGSGYSVHFFVKKFLALNNYNQALVIFEKTGDAEKTKEKLLMAVKKDNQDEYNRTLSELSLVSLGKILTDKSISEDKVVSLFRQWLDLATSSALEAIKVNKTDPANWMQLGRVYESFISLKISGADEAALNAYAEAFRVSPLDPSPFVSSARVVLQMNKSDEAKKYLQSALVFKLDMTDALFMLSQIEAKEGNLKEAILKAEQSAVSSPNNPSILFQLGLLNYQNKTFNNAKSAFESAVAINPEFANARYFLGLIYDKSGEKNKAIEQFEIIKKTNPDNQEIDKILKNLAEGKSALSEVSPPLPEKRSELPIAEKNQAGLKGAKKK